MTTVQPYTFPDTGDDVRALSVNGNAWFVGRDAAAALGHANPARAVRDHVPAVHRGVTESVTPHDLHGLDRQTVLISEPGLYRLIMRSNTADAERFQEWVTAEVLPSIRRTGGYGAAPSRAALSRKEMARYWYEAEERAEAAEEHAAALAPAADAWTALADAEGDYSVREAAQILDRDPHIKTGRNRLFAQMRDLRWIDRGGEPYQHQVDTGRLVRRTTSYPHPHSGEPQLSAQVRITPKGVEKLRELLGGGAQLDIGGGAA